MHSFFMIASYKNSTAPSWAMYFNLELTCLSATQIQVFLVYCFKLVQLDGLRWDNSTVADGEKETWISLSL